MSNETTWKKMSGKRGKKREKEVEEREEGEGREKELELLLIILIKKKSYWSSRRGPVVNESD